MLFSYITIKSELEKTHCAIPTYQKRTSQPSNKAYGKAFNSLQQEDKEILMLFAHNQITQK